MLLAARECDVMLRSFLEEWEPKGGKKEDNTACEYAAVDGFAKKREILESSDSS